MKTLQLIPGKDKFALECFKTKFPTGYNFETFFHQLRQKILILLMNEKLCHLRWTI